jgi:hypothetical protein
VDTKRRELVQEFVASPLGRAFERPVQWFYDPMAVTAFAGQMGEVLTVYDCLYLANALVESDLLKQIIAATESDTLRLRYTVPMDALPIGGLTIYGSECGRFPVCPTVIVEW